MGVIWIFELITGGRNVVRISVLPVMGLIESYFTLLKSKSLFQEVQKKLPAGLYRTLLLTEQVLEKKVSDYKVQS